MLIRLKYLSHLFKIRLTKYSTGRIKHIHQRLEGLTPPVNSEHFTIKRSYSMRPSTVRKFNALKADHPDINVLFNTIVDMGLSYYYNYIFNGSGTFYIQQEKIITS